MTTAIMLFRRDLRLKDNPALTAACATHTHVLPLYIYSDREEAPWQIGSASQWWLHHSLQALQQQLQKRGTALLLDQGNTLDVLRQVIKESGATAIYWNRLYDPALIKRDT